jgi:transcriptional regulator with XRE-family HTH domain
MSIDHVEDLQSSLGQRLKSERLRLSLTQEALAKRVDVVVRSIIGYEQGTTTIRSDILYRLAAAGIDVSYVLFGDGPGADSPIDEALMRRVYDWAENSLRDLRGRPLPGWERHQRAMHAYRWLASSRTPEELEERFAQLPAARVA